MFIYILELLPLCGLDCDLLGDWGLKGERLSHRQEPAQCTVSRGIMRRWNKIACALAISLEIGDWRESTSLIVAWARSPKSLMEGHNCIVFKTSSEIYHCLFISDLLWNWRLVGERISLDCDLLGVWRLGSTHLSWKGATQFPVELQKKLISCILPMIFLETGDLRESASFVERNLHSLMYSWNEGGCTVSCGITKNLYLASCP